MKMQIVLVLIALMGAAFVGLAYGQTHVQNSMIVTIKPGGGTILSTIAPSPSQPTFTLYNSKTVWVNASSSTGQFVSTTGPRGIPILVWIPAHTYAWYNGKAYADWNFTIATFNIAGVGNPPGGSAQTPDYAFAYEVDHQINASWWFSNANGTDVALPTTAHYPSTWSSWAWLGGTLSSNGNSYTGGAYGSENTWAYNSTTMNITNTQFTEPIMWVFTTGAAPASTTPSVTQTVTPTVSPTAAPTTSTSAVSAPSGNTELYAGIVIVIIIILIIAWWAMSRGKGKK